MPYRVIKASATDANKLKYFRNEKQIIKHDLHHNNTTQTNKEQY